LGYVRLFIGIRLSRSHAPEKSPLIWGLVKLTDTLTLSRYPPAFRAIASSGLCKPGGTPSLDKVRLPVSRVASTDVVALLLDEVSPPKGMTFNLTGEKQ